MERLGVTPQLLTASRAFLVMGSIALTRDGAGISGIPYVMESDTEEVEKNLRLRVEGY
jgi:hypothetical protein